MKPPPFQYFVPSNVEETLELLEQHGYEAKILAGGQSLVPLMNFRLIQPRALLDINRIEGHSSIELSGDELRIGAFTRQRTIEKSPLVQEHCPILSHAARFVASPAVRNRGTLGGSLAHADPAAEFPLVVTALGGQILVRSKKGERTLTSQDFFLGPLTTALAPTELVVEVRFPIFGPSTGWGFLELGTAPRALVAAAAVLKLDKSGACREAGLALGGVGLVPLRIPKAEKLLRGERPNEALIAEAAGLGSEIVDPLDDIHASGEYRKAMAVVYLRRALRDAFERAQSREGWKQNGSN